MKLETLRLLMCPYCGGPLQIARGAPETGDEVEHGILRCACSEFPVVAGIPIFKKGRVDVMTDTEDAALRSGPAVNVLIELIRSGQHEKALMLLLIPPDRLQARVSRVVEFLPRPYRQRIRNVVSLTESKRRSKFRVLMSRPTALDVFDFLFRRLRLWPAELYNYFGFRFGQPRHLAGLSLASLLPSSPKPILDLACGFGHLLHHWTVRCPGRAFVGLDRNFFLLYVAKKWMAPTADYVCCEADMTLPFATGRFGGVFCSDAFHLFLRKVQCVRETQRVIDTVGIIILARVGNALVKPNEGYELAPDAYASLFEGLPCRLVSDQTLLRRYLEKLGPALKDPAPPATLKGEKWISLVAARDGNVFRDHGRFETWPHGTGRLVINPLYRERGKDSLGNTTFEFTFPSQHYEFENADCRKYVPDNIQVSSSVLEDLRSGTRSADIEELIRQCVILGVPAKYC